MVIVCSTDDKYVQHCVLMLISLALHNSDVKIYILTDKLSESNKILIKDEMKPYDVALHFIQVDSNIITSLPMPNNASLRHISLATYYRLFISKLLPAEDTKVIYLDCDIIVNNSLKDLWDTDINDFALGAVAQVGDSEDCIRLGISETKGYFNAGVLLINLDYWRRHNVESRFLEYIALNRNKIIYHDQDVLNVVLHNEYKGLSIKWNLTSDHYNPFFKKYINKDKSLTDHQKTEIRNELRLLKKNPVIVHYVFIPKPWEKWCFSIHQQLYYETAKRSKHFKHLRYCWLANKLAFYKYYIVMCKNELMEHL